jgi:hypothetical protein
VPREDQTRAPDLRAVGRTFRGKETGPPVFVGLLMEHFRPVDIKKDVRIDARCSKLGHDSQWFHEFASPAPP